MSTDEALTDESGDVSYVDLSTVPAAAPTVCSVGRCPESVTLALMVLFTLLSFVAMWVYVIHATRH